MVVVDADMLIDIICDIVVDISLDIIFFCMMVGVNVNMFSNGMLDVSAADMWSRILVMTTLAATLELVVALAYIADVLLDVLSLALIDVVPDIDVDMLTDENENGLEAVMTPFDFTLSSP